MKLHTLHEASHHLDPREQFLKKHFELDDEEQTEGWHFQQRYPKSDLLVTVEWDNGADLAIGRIVSGKEGNDPWHDEIFPAGWDDPLPQEYELQHLDVWKKIS